MSGSITECLIALRNGERDAAAALWIHYYPRLVKAARARLNDTPRQVSDEEDLAVSVFQSFCRAIDEGRLPNICDRTDLWRLLLSVTARKAINAHRYHAAQKRARPAGSSATDASLLQGEEPSAEFCARVAEVLTRLLTDFGDGDLRQIAIYKLQGYTTAQMAEMLGTSCSTIERKLRRIRHEWSEHVMD